MLGKTERRLALVILLTAILPLASAMLLAYSMLNYASSVWLRPEIEVELERGIGNRRDDDIRPAHAVLENLERGLVVALQDRRA